MRALPLVLLVGCMGAAEETLVDELRVVSVRGTPPILDLTAGTTITATVFDPQVAPVEVLLWSCTPGPNGCFEAGPGGAATALSDWTTLAAPEDEEVSLSVTGSPDLVDVLGGVELPPAFVWALACEEGLCPLHEEVRAAPEAGSDAWQAVVDQLADPFSLAETLPLVGTSLVFRTFEAVALPVDAERPQNPRVTRLDEGFEIPSGETLTLRFAVEAEETVLVYPVASAGGFRAQVSEVSEGEVEVTLVAGVPDSEEAPPLEPGTVLQTYVSFEGDNGGSSLWRGTFTVQ